jgi:hypothetical protein
MTDFQKFGVIDVLAGVTEPYSSFNNCTRPFHEIRQPDFKGLPK